MSSPSYRPALYHALWITTCMLMTLIIAALSCGTNPQPEQFIEELTQTSSAFPQFPMTIVDSNGKNVVFSEPPNRIIAFSSVPLEVLFAIGEGKRIVGTHDFATYPEEVSEIPKVGSAFNVNPERIIELEPDLIYTFYQSSLSDLDHLGVKVLYLNDAETILGIVEQIRLLGRLTGQPVRAEELAQKFESQLHAIEEEIGVIESGPRIFHDASPGFWTAGPETLIGQAYHLLKAQNIAMDISGNAQLNPEVIVDRDPEIIIATFKESLEIYKSDPAFELVSAVKNGRLYHIPGDLIEIAGPRFAEGISELAMVIYPDIFH